MHHYHLENEGIPENINALEESHKKSKWAGNSIMAVTLLLITTNVMISTERFPCDEKIWKELSKENKDWAAWKNLYKAADQKVNVNKQAVGGQYQLGEAHVALKQSPSPS